MNLSQQVLKICESDVVATFVYSRDDYDVASIKKAMKAAGGFGGSSQKTQGHVLVTIKFKSRNDADKFKQLLDDDTYLSRYDDWSMDQEDEI